MSFRNPRDIWEKKYANVFGQNEKTHAQIILDVVALLIHNEDNTDLSNLYDAIGLEAFTKMVELFDGRPVDIPAKDDLRDKLLLAMCYYYNVIEGRDWDEITGMLPFEINTVSMGIRISNLNKNLRRKMETLLSKVEEE